MVDVDLSGGVGAGFRRRRRSAEERRWIVEKTLLAGSSVERVAQRHGVNANQVFQWRRLYQSGLLGGPVGSGLKLLPISVTEDAAPAKLEQAEAASASQLPVAAAGSIHNGYEVHAGKRYMIRARLDRGIAEYLESVIGRHASVAAYSPCSKLLESAVPSFPASPICTTNPAQQ